MSQHVASLKPVYFTEEEALALLDVCLISSGDSDAVKESALLKITDLIRRYISACQFGAEENIDSRDQVKLTADSMPACILSWLGSEEDTEDGAKSASAERLSDRKHRVYNALLSLVS